MKRTYFMLFLLLDFASLVIVFLLFTYYGMCHVLLLLIGLIFLLMGLYDLQTGVLSALIRQLFKMPVKSIKGGKLNIIPMIMAIIVIWYSFPQVLQYGLINTSQGSLMQGNYFVQFTVWLVGASLFVLIAAIGSYVGGKKGDE